MHARVCVYTHVWSYVLLKFFHIIVLLQFPFLCNDTLFGFTCHCIPGYQNKIKTPPSTLYPPSNYRLFFFSPYESTTLGKSCMYLVPLFPFTLSSPCSSAVFSIIPRKPLSSRCPVTSLLPYRVVISQFFPSPLSSI